MDTTPPAVSLTVPSRPDKQPEPSFSGGAGTAPGRHRLGDVEDLLGRKSCPARPIRTLAVNGDGSTWNATLTPTEALPEGTYTAQAEQSDEAGNTGKSATSTFAVETRRRRRCR